MVTKRLIILVLCFFIVFAQDINDENDGGNDENNENGDNIQDDITNNNKNYAYLPQCQGIYGTRVTNTQPDAYSCSVACMDNNGHCHVYITSGQCVHFPHIK